MTDEAIREDVDRRLRAVLDGIADLVAVIAAPEAAKKLVSDLEAGGCIGLTFRPSRGHVDLSVSGADGVPRSIFAAVPAPSEEHAGEPIN